MASIEKRITSEGETRYRVRITLKDMPRVNATFDTRKEAREWGKDTEHAMRKGKFNPGSEAEKRTMGDLVDRYSQDKLPGLSTQENTGRTLDWWRDQLGENTRLSQITPAVIASAKDRLAGGESLSGRKPSPSTVKRYLTVLSSAMSTATKEWFWLDDNPCTKVVRPSDPRGRVRCLDKDERDRLLSACKAGKTEHLYPLVVTALCTGARRGELMRLRWRDVDLDRGIAILHQTKNGERRSLAITGMAEQVLREWRGVSGQDDLVFSRNGSTAFPRGAWKRALTRAGIKDLRFHDLRHTFASYLAMSGATLAELAEAMGHKTLVMVKRYAHLTHGHTASVVARMTERFMAAA